MHNTRRVTGLLSAGGYLQISKPWTRCVKTHRQHVTHRANI